MGPQDKHAESRSRRIQPVENKPGLYAYKSIPRDEKTREEIVRIIERSNCNPTQKNGTSDKPGSKK